MDWKHKDMWSLRGKNFLVQISRHGEEKPESERSFCYDEEGPHRWCVYAYIYPDHPNFGKFEGDAIWQEASGALPLHGGCSFLRYHRSDDGAKVTSVQVGCDYNHLHDTEFTRYATKDEAYEVFADAEALYQRLDGIQAVEKAKEGS